MKKNVETNKKCLKCVHCKVCEYIDDGIQMCCSGWDGCEMFEDLKTATIRMFTESCEKNMKYYDVVDECKETIDYKKIFEEVMK